MLIVWDSTWAEHVERLRAQQTLAASLATRLVEYKVARYGRYQLYDPLALAVLLDMSLFKLVSAAVKVVTVDGPLERHPEYAWPPV